MVTSGERSAAPRSRAGRRAASALTLLAALACAAPAQAVPVLQLYVEGSTYDQEHESWVFDASGGDPIRLWVIGNVSGPGSHGVISDVKIAITYPDPVPGDGGAAIEFSLTPVTTGGFGGFTDPSTPSAPTLSQKNDDGDIPLLSDGSPIATHGVFGDGWEWQEFLLGDFDLTDSPVADFIDAFPDPAFADAGQINAYEIQLVQGTVDEVHIDAYNHVQSGNKSRAVFAPFSHDAGTGINEPVPAPATLALAAGALLLAGWRRRPR